ncbi:uncharacterized protein PFL1_02200 [Pseudozyma flocculosa PF-1]|uniref:Related to beta-1,3-glucan binding protein n=1 Tax=Pseudozyma flocculosa TaxID=84751 RepID=A0A5C3FCR8_9BASI|nr:uncharacterized protein PFL1_02200 [Pseudozyma flocculosa PF-1]EPQ30083.1 hypothetical protein PFL1_02200 [Pseudozyma flocculosa PF-1]SPO41427.1 related to beta-1,3-glucan binding protein [Pseudozyma flocculosa]
MSQTLVNVKAAGDDARPVLWTNTKRGKRIHRRNSQIFYFGVCLGLAAVVGIVLDGVLRIERSDKLCLVLDDDFSRGLDPSVWTREVQTSGYGTGQFDWTTDSDNNAFVRDDKLYIVPTLTNESIGAASFEREGHTIDLGQLGTCTSPSTANCIAANNATVGQIINPVQSARLTTRASHSITFGKVSVRAKLPTGDWLWPAIWMMPREETYGGWPASGEIDIMESAGNRPRHRMDSRSRATVLSTFQFGPAWYANAGERHTASRSRWRGYFDSGFHDYVLEWNEHRMRVYIDNPNNLVKEFRFPKKQSMWHYGRFNEYDHPDGPLRNPWIRSTRPNVAPFDQPFYLILDVAVGGQFFNGDRSDLPWNPSSPQPAALFWRNVDLWYPTWPASHTDRGMAIDRVRMWQKC